jgi:hypothetical protein
MARNVFETPQQLHDDAEEVFADDRVQAVVSVRVAGGTLGYGHQDLSLAQAVIDTANARGFTCLSVTPFGEFMVLLFDPDTTGIAADDEPATEG